VFLLGLLPALAPLLPGVSLRSAVVVVPIANAAVAAKEILVGVFDWPLLLVSWVVNAAAALLLARLATRALSNERLASPLAAEGERVPGPVAFQRQVLRNFAVLWGVLLVVNSNLPASTDIRLQLLVNLGVIFLGGTLAMVRIYHLEPAQVFALRPVPPAVWLAVAVGAPAGLLTGVGVFQLASLFVPVPREMLEALGEALLPEGLPFWQVVVFLCLAPGIVEELTFRGALLHGLRRRFHPVVLALVVGVVFGVFHTSLFRIAPTAFIGVLLAGVTLLSGSIFPAMVWHALNNLLGLAAARAGLPLESLEPPLLAAAAMALAGAFWILWRTRSVYPDLRGERRR
ncbi:MAG: CPBP family intramembrane metalloprotease, partial [Thermoanaerobaculaceae bacterium]|nr:CPBP family intramembrane metalloprotease [Thermoanaerobaculaceae bacterium]